MYNCLFVGDFITYSKINRNLMDWLSQKNCYVLLKVIKLAVAGEL